MFPKVNGKSFLELAEEDLEVLIDNPDFRENDYIDYKENFAFLEIPKEKKEIIASKTAEFRNDVCSFANAEGGYLVYGISDYNGCAKEIIGITIQDDNTDKFELARRTNLDLIRPRIPYLKFNFIKLQSGKYVVVIFVKHDSFAPYMHIEDEKNYKIYKRYGNGKNTIPYTELKNMFLQSVSLDKEILNYRKERIEYYHSQSESDNSIYNKFLLLHFFPETFVDSSYNKNMFILERESGKRFSSIFSSLGVDSLSQPCVDGLRFCPYGGDVQAECHLNNNGIAECFLSLFENFLAYDNGKTYICYECIWDKISDICTRYINTFKDVFIDENIYVGISLIGCKGIISNSNNLGQKILIDRDNIICSPTVISCSDNENIASFLKKLKIEFLLSMGIKNTNGLNKLIQEVYNV